MKFKMKNAVSDVAHGAFILNVMKFTAKVDVMVALNNLKKSLRKAKAMTFCCAICDKPYLIEDSYTCQRCGKSVCEDHAIVMKNAPDDYEMVCTDCLENKYDVI